MLPALDAAGMTVTPGFIDAHCHPDGVRELFEVDGNLRSIAALEATIAKQASGTPPGNWVNAYMFDNTKLSDGRPLHRRDLDEVSPNHPVSVHHRGGHTSWYSSVALRLAGVTRATPDPDHGRFFRDPDGEPNGRVAEQARQVLANVGLRTRYTPEQERDRGRQGLRHMSRLSAAAGLTTVHHMYAEQDDLRAYQDVRGDGGLRHRAYLMVGPDAHRHLRDAGVRTGMGDEWVRIGGAKRSADGSASERTMRMSTPYVGTNDFGILTMTREGIHDAVDDAHTHGWQVGFHANGDVTIDMVLAAYERAMARWPHPDRRHRIEHCSLVNPALLRRRLPRRAGSGHRRASGCHHSVARRAAATPRVRGAGLTVAAADGRDWKRAARASWWSARCRTGREADPPMTRTTTPRQRVSDS